MKYTIAKNLFDEDIITGIREDGSMISFMADPANSDYQAYLNKDKPQVEHLTEIIPADEAKTK